MGDSHTMNGVHDGTLHIALCVTDQSGEYYRHALVTMTSVLEHTTCPVAFHILHDDTLLPNLSGFESTVARYAQHVFFHNLEGVDFSRMAAFAGKWGKGTLFRLAVHEYVSAERVLYLDCDIVVMRDLAELLALDMGGAAIAVVGDSSAVKRIREAVRRLDKLGIPPERYFNAGVMLMNAARLREAGDGYVAEVTEYMASGTTYPDQDALNLYYAKRPEQVMFLDEKFNQQINYVLLETHMEAFDWYAGRVLHYSNPKKPWRYYSHAALMYWKYYALAFPLENVMERITATGQHKFNALCIFLLGSPKLRGLVRRLRDLEAGGLWFAIRKRLFPGGQ